MFRKNMGLRLVPVNMQLYRPNSCANTFGVTNDYYTFGK